MTPRVPAGPIGIEWVEAPVDDRRGASTAVVSHDPPVTAFARRTVDWFAAEGRPSMRGTDLAVRRVLFVPFPRAAGALADVLVALRRPGTATATVVTRHGRLRVGLDPVVVSGSTSEERRTAQAHVHRLGPALGVDLVLAPWSPWQSELRLQLHGGRGAPRLPRRYYDVAHPALAALRDLIELRVGPA